ncbi:hypothetical protein DFR80_1673 [Halanaerobium sp. ST460_2HS_T2]|nr:hypothetical protein DFR80_1673 [Halanaerobium sp. ST460_2HS_T2]
MHNIPKNIMNEIKKAMKRPEGTVEFKYECEDIFNPSVAKIIIFEIISGNQLFILERNREMNIVFYHSSPGAGTRATLIKLDRVPKVSKMSYVFTWNHEEINLYIHPLIENYDLIVSKETTPDVKFRVSKDGSVIRLGNKGIDIMQTKIRSGGKKILDPTAIESWNDTLKAIEILKSAQSDKGYMYDVVVSNFIISSLVTGFETYGKTRFIELEKEGIEPNIEELENRVFSSYEKEIDLPEKYKDKSTRENISYIEIIAQEKINFQNFNECKRAFNKAYGLVFGEIIHNTNKINELKKIINYRHRIIHVSPLITMLNENKVPEEEPVFSNDSLSTEAVEVFKYIVDQIHTASLKLRN